MVEIAYLAIIVRCLLFNGQWRREIRTIESLIVEEGGTVSRKSCAEKVLAGMKGRKKIRIRDCRVVHPSHQRRGKGVVSALAHCDEAQIEVEGPLIGSKKSLVRLVKPFFSLIIRHDQSLDTSALMSSFQKLPAP